MEIQEKRNIKSLLEFRNLLFKFINFPNSICIKIPCLSILFVLKISLLQGQIDISTSEGKITAKVITSVNASHVVTNSAVTEYRLGYMSGMQCIGDIDNDGLDDYAVCTEEDSYTAARSQANQDGIAYIFFGRTINNYYTNNDMPVEDKADMVLILNQSGWFGSYVSRLGDINGDGISDFAINSPNESSGAGCLYIFFGRSRSDWKLDINVSNITGFYSFGSGFPANRSNMTDAQKFKYKYVDDGGNGIADFIFKGRTNSNDMFGRNVSEAGDVDGDGVDDIIVGATGWTDNSVLKRGKVYVIRGMKKGSGGNGVDWGTTRSIVLDNSSNTTVPFIGYKSLDASNENPGYEQLGYAVAGVGDMNLDGVDDICFGGENSDQASGCPALSSYTISGVNYQSLASNTHTYRLGKAYMVFGNKNHFFDSWTSSNKSTTNANVTFISGYTLFTPTSGNLNAMRWSGMIGTIISKGGLLCPDPNDPTKRLNTMLLSEPANDFGITNYRFNNYGKAYIFFAKSTWASIYDFGNPGSHNSWSYTSLVNYGDLPTSRTSSVLSPSLTGMGLRNVGDIDGDGFEDIAISSHYDGNENVNAVTLLYGGLTLIQYENGGSLIDVKSILTGGAHALKSNLKYIIGEKSGTQTHLCFTSKPGDINGDGVNDLVITDYLKTIDNISDAGTCYIDLQCKKGEDLYGQDNPEDNGKEPNTYTWRVFDSPDIWNRVDLNTNTVVTEVTSSLIATDFIHTNPDPKTTTTGDTKNHGLVRIHNRGCSASTTGVWKVQLFWTLASTGETWPDKWDASTSNSATFNNCNSSIPSSSQYKGGLIGTYTLNTSIPSGGTIILDFPWDPPAPAKYKEISNCSGRLDVCLLARIVKVAATSNTIQDKSITGLTTSEDIGLSSNVKNNNNIFTKNLMIVDLPGNGVVQRIATIGNPNISNPFAFTIKTNIHFQRDEKFKSSSLYNIGTNSYLTIGLPTSVYNSWVTQGSVGTDVEDLFTTDINGLRLIKIKSDKAVLNNIIMSQGASFTAQLNYNIDPEFIIPNDFEFENMVMIKQECDMNDSNYNNSYKLWYISNYNTTWEEIGGMNYHYKIY